MLNFDDEAASRIVSALETRTERKLRSGAKTETTWARIATVSPYMTTASAYLYGETDAAYLSDGFRIPDALYVSVGDIAKVGMNYQTGDRWIEEVNVKTPYKKVAIDINGGRVLTGSGLVPPTVGGTPAGTVFPSSPATNDQFFRTDLNTAFFYDGVQWLSSTLYHMQLTPWATALPASVSASTTALNQAGTPMLDNGTDIWLEDWQCSFYVAGSGSSLSSTQKWQVDLKGVRDNTDMLEDTYATLAINSGSSVVSRKSVVPINALMNASFIHNTLRTTVTKTGTPGNLQIFDSIAYRIAVPPVTPPGDTTPPVISNLLVSLITTTSVQVSWDLNEGGTGQVKYGLTSSYGTLSTKENSFLTTHIQTLSGLTPNTTYHYAVVSVDSSGNSVQSTDATFTTLNDSPNSMYNANVYGPGIGIQSKNNYQVGWTNNAKVAIRFICSQSSAPTVVAANIRGSGAGTGANYSGGTGGTIKASIQANASGVPSGTDLCAVTWSPGNPAGHWEDKGPHTFSGSPPTLSNGTTYWLVFTNVDASPTANWISVNFGYNPFLWSNPTNRQPAYTDDLAAFNNQGSGWNLTAADLPPFDITYANGNHDGNAFYGANIIPAARFNTISGTTNMVRARFTVSGGTRTLINRIGVYVWRDTGSGALTITLEDSGGSTIASGTVASTNWPASGSSASIGDPFDGARWGIISISPTTLTNGSTYRVRISCPAGTTYYTAPVQWNDTFDAYSPWGSKGYSDGITASGGSLEMTTNSGSSWAPEYSFLPGDLMFYLAAV